MKKTSPCIEKAIKDVTGFKKLYSLMECSIIISGKSESTLIISIPINIDTIPKSV